MSERVPRRRGRRPAGEDTRGAIIAAARSVFAAKGYEAATMRGIARVAGVDPRLVHHYFAGKEDVFVEAMQFPVRPTQVIGAAVEPGVEGLGERMIRVFFGAWDGPEQRERVKALLGSAATSAEGARMLSEFVSEEILGRVSAQLTGPDRELRAELAAAQMIGMAFVRYVVRVEPLASAPVEQLVELLAPTVQRYLGGEGPDGTGGGDGRDGTGGGDRPDGAEGGDGRDGAEGEGPDGPETGQYPYAPDGPDVPRAEGRVEARVESLPSVEGPAERPCVRPPAGLFSSHDE